MISCQSPGCEALAEVKVREVNIETGEIMWWRYLCLVHLEEEYGPWLAFMKDWRSRLLAESEKAMSTTTESPSSTALPSTA